MIYDCFVFYDELDLLEIRLNTLDAVVDRFVLVEATQTFSKVPKKLFYQENKERFKKFNDKIIHVVVDDFPRFNWKKLRPTKNWDLEDFQRNALKRGLVNCADEDVILFSDVDEIPRPELVKKYAQTPGIKTFYQEMYYYYLNYLVVDHSEPNEFYNDYKPWHGTVMAAYKYFKKSPNDMRTYRSRKDDLHVRVMDGGWHFSFMGGAEMILKKMKAYAHTEYMRDEMLTVEWIKTQLETGRDVFDRPYTFKKVDISQRGPDYVIQNQERYKHLIMS